ncbi:MAG: XshC-Cox1-family protein [Gemmatimonadetes bacterium]|nr:XshC-Cox1-family protein [Gemmatimonadota bacterium]
MRELDNIRSALTAAAARGESVVLATVMSVEGSVYRGAGARMVITAGATTIGAVSGGCLEADIVARAPDLRHAELVRYDTRASDDVILGLGLGCQGIIDILLEPFSGPSLHEAIAFYTRLATQREPVTLLTLLREEPVGPLLGARVMLGPTGDVIHGDARLLHRPHDVAREVVRPAPPLVVCGGGTDAIPLVTLARQMGMHVTVIDHRSSFANADRFPDAHDIVCANLSDNPAALANRVTLDERTMGVSMAHAAIHDGAYIRALLDANAAYIGVLGPRRRTMELLGSPAELPQNVHAPVGLDLGAETPDEIALAIVAEIAAVSAGRRGGMLRDRTGPIHERSGQR